VGDHTPGRDPSTQRHGFASWGDNSVLTEPVVSIVNPAGIAVGSWVHIGAYAVIEALVPDRGVTVRIDDGAYIGHFFRLSAMRDVHIGREAMISDRVYISDTGHRYEDVTVPIKRQGLRDDGSTVSIGDGSWIGIGAVIVGDVRIGANSVVAANSVVRADVPDGVVVAGDPAVVLREHTDDGWRSVRARPAPPPG
jgi:acetyltransferase-like isoleucine patch superfamily enzyme